MAKTDRTKWYALGVLCLGTLMIVLDTTIVNVALPSIRADLGFTESSLAWVVNAYILTFGGSLLLGGRLGDLFGHRRLFLIGLTVFTLASLVCGVATSQWMLVGARIVQGIGGAIVSAVSLSLMVTMFTDEHERARAMGFLGFIAAGGGAIGVLLGGLLTSLNWHLIFLVNLPIGIIVFLLSLKLLPHSRMELEHRHLDAAGATLITLALLIANYAVINGNASGWLSLETLGLLVVAAIFLVAFIAVEKRTRAPLMPLRLWHIRNVWAANLIGVLWAAAMFAWFFLSALYLQLVLGYAPLSVGLAFLPSNLIMAAFSVWLSPYLVNRFGIKKPMALGLGIASLGLFLFARAPVNGQMLIDVLPAMILLGIGAGMAFNPVLLAAMNDVEGKDAGLASGLVNTSFMLGGSLGLAILASVAAARTAFLSTAGIPAAEALNVGYNAAFFIGGCFALLAAVLSGALIKERRLSQAAPVLH